MKPAIFKLLAIENNPLLSSLLKILLNRPELVLIGHARNATQALCILAEQTPDVIIIDNHLPDQCGLETIPLVLEKAPRAKVILLTDQDDFRYERAAKEKGAHACLRKDLIATTLLPSISQVLNIALDYHLKVEPKPSMENV